MLRCIEDGVAKTFLHDQTFIHHNHAICDLLDNTQIMADEQT